MNGHDWIFATRITAARIEAAAAERERIRQLAIKVEAQSIVDLGPEGRQWRMFADLLKEEE